MEQILSTKLYIPPLPAKRVSRLHLIERISERVAKKLTLVSAPAGFGKTTIVCEWIEHARSAASKTSQEQNYTWLSLNERDNDLVRFLTYLIAALRQPKEIGETLGEDALGMLQSPQPPNTQAILTSLINDLTTYQGKINLVLDDFHLISDPAIDKALEFLIEYQPSQLHLVIITRVDPQLPLARLRAGGQLIEIRAADLRFNENETAKFLNEVMELDLAEEAVTTLASRTEGWIAGLQLAAISFRGGKNDTHEIETFSGSHRLVLDYLIEEVLEQQSESLQNFLLKTSILTRMTGDLCEALTGQKNGQETLEMLEHANLFLIPLDEERRWYRYHHLFADLLRKRLGTKQPGEVSKLHQRASEWFEQAGFTNEAIDHALIAKDFSHAANLIDTHADEIWQRVEHTKLRGWLEKLPEELMLSHPQFCIYQAWNLFASGQQDEAEKFLLVVEQNDEFLATYDDETELDDESWQSQQKIRGRAAAIRSWMAAYRSDIQGIIKHSSQALDCIPANDLNWRNVAAITLGDAYFLKGEYNSGYKARMESLEASRAVNNIYLQLNVGVKLAINLKAQGKLKEIIEISQQQLSLAKNHGMAHTAVAGWLQAIWGEVLAERNQLKEALDLTMRGKELTERGGDVAMLGWSYLCLARVLFSKGDLDKAGKILLKLERTAQKSTVPIWIMNYKSLWQTRIWLAQDNLEDANTWLGQRELKPDAEPTNVSGLEYIALARILIAQGKCKESQPLLQYLLEQAQNGGNLTREIEVLILLTLAFYAENKEEKAMESLEKAIDLAEPSGFIRIFVDEGPKMAQLLYEALSREIAPEYTSRLLAAFDSHHPIKTEPTTTQIPVDEIIEPLSNREIEVIQLIAEGLTNQEIASRLFLSLNTVKVHARNIFQKLGVSNRTEATAKAKALGFLTGN